MIPLLNIILSGCGSNNCYMYMYAQNREFKETSIPQAVKTD